MNCIFFYRVDRAEFSLDIRVGRLCFLVLGFFVDRYLFLLFVTFVFIFLGDCV